MKKKAIVICSAAALVAVAVLLYVVLGRAGLKTVTVDGYGSISVPEEWTATDVDGFLHISREKNGESVDVLVRYDNEDGVNPQFADIADFERLQDTNYSNSASCGKEKVSYSDGSTDELIVLRLTGYENDESTMFICVDKSASEKQLQEIAKSYECKQPEG